MTNQKSPGSRSVNRIFEILELLAQYPEGLSMMQIVESLNNPPKSSIYTVLQQMVKNRYVTYMAKQKRYKIGPALVKLSAVIITKHTIAEHARPLMEHLSSLTGEDVYLGILEGNRVCYIDKVEGTESIRLNISVGATRYLHTSSIGKLLLAYLDDKTQKNIIEETGLPAVSKNTISDYEEFRKELSRIRKLEYSTANEESIEGVMGMAAPIKDSENQVIAGICISAPVSRVIDKKDQLIDLVKDTALRISEQLGFDRVR